MALTFLALISFALNSLLCRAALGSDRIDAASFTLVRLASGAAVLLLITRSSNRPVLGRSRWSPWSVALSAAALFFYALPFSLAYQRISAGTGAFVVFCCVQATMIGADVISGGRLRLREGVGLCLALLGLVYLTRPGFESPDPGSVLLMAGAGFFWGLYSLRGRNSGPALQATALNFAASVPLALVVSASGIVSPRVTASGLFLAAVSGGITSGLGYVAWYAALPSLSPTRAAIVQLSVPPLASFLGVLFLQERLTTRLLIAAPLILGGIAVAVVKPRVSTRSSARNEAVVLDPKSG